MDLSLISAAVTSINAARDLGKSAINLRDFNEMAAIVRQLNDQILKAQDRLFTLTGELLREQQKHLEAVEKIREMQQSFDDRREYDLVDIGKGFHAYQRKAAAVPDTEVAPTLPRSSHYICQPCFDGTGTKSTLQPELYMGARIGFACRACKERFITGDTSNLNGEFERLGAGLNRTS